jgi:hypothetical protein
METRHLLHKTKWYCSMTQHWEVQTISPANSARLSLLNDNTQDNEPPSVTGKIKNYYSRSSEATKKVRTFMLLVPDFCFVSPDFSHFVSDLSSHCYSVHKNKHVKWKWPARTSVLLNVAVHSSQFRLHSHSPSLPYNARMLVAPVKSICRIEKWGRQTQPEDLNAKPNLSGHHERCWPRISWFIGVGTSQPVARTLLKDGNNIQICMPDGLPLRHSLQRTRLFS